MQSAVRDGQMLEHPRSRSASSPLLVVPGMETGLGKTVWLPVRPYPLQGLQLDLPTSPQGLALYGLSSVLIFVDFAYYLMMGSCLDINVVLCVLQSDVFGLLIGEKKNCQ